MRVVTTAVLDPATSDAIQYGKRGAKPSNRSEAAVVGGWPALRLNALGLGAERSARRVHSVVVSVEMWWKKTGGHTRSSSFRPSRSIGCGAVLSCVIGMYIINWL